MFDVALYPTMFVSYSGTVGAVGDSGREGVLDWRRADCGGRAHELVLGAKVVGESSVAFSALLLSPFAVLDGLRAAASRAGIAPDST